MGIRKRYQEKTHWETSKEKMLRKGSILKFDVRGRRERQSKLPRRVKELYRAVVELSLKCLML